MSPELSPALAAALGALQGVAEFLPISSSGHLALAESLAGLDPAAVGHSFNIVVHAGTLLAVLLHYRADLLALARAALRAEPSHQDMSNATGPLGHALTDTQSYRALLLALVIGTLPLAAALAPPVEAVVIAAEHHPRAVGACFLVTAAALVFAELRTRRQRDTREVPRVWQALLIGLAQLLAILPGISRSGATIAAAMALGLGRLPAARFSFLLAIPAILGASLKEAVDLVQGGAPGSLDPLAFAIGFLVSFLVGVATLRVLLVMLVRVGVLPFVPYLVVLALVVLALG